MNKKFTLGAFFIFAIFVSALFTNSVSAKTADEDSALVSTTIVISQVYGGGGGSTGTYMFDYVELKNISGTPQSLNGLSLMYGSAAGQFGGSATNVFALPTGVTLQPGQYYLVQLSSAGSGGAALPVTPDAVTGNLSMSGSSGKIALTNGLAANSCGATATPCTLPNAQIIDLVAYGAASNAEGGAATNGDSALTSSQGSVRKSSGCQDTDNNNNDFTIVTDPVPRNSATTLAPCGGGTTPAARGTLFDFTGNGKTDWTTLVIPTSGPIFWKIAGNPAAPGANQAFIRSFDYGLRTSATSGDTPVPQDYSGDKKTEVAVWRPGAQSIFYVSQFPLGPGPLTLERAVPFGTTGDNPNAVGDYDGDGKIDYTVSRDDGNTITWYSILSSTNTLRAVALGIPSAALNFAVVNGADFNGDGRDELVFFTISGDCSSTPVAPCSITYYANDSANGTGVFVRQFGNFNSDFTITPADYTGDKKADLVAVRQTSGPQVWYILNSATNAVTATQFGISDTDVRNDVQVRGDYDGDGRQDIAVWRRANQTFYYISSANGTIGGQQWGTAGDTPLGSFGIF